MPASSSANRQRNEKRGHRAETAALILLRLKGYRLLARRFKSHHGEIDLIMRKGQTTAFIEVKARSTTDAAISSVTTYQSKRISAAPDYGCCVTLKQQRVFVGLILSR